jgi:hypothetical protein
MSNATRISTKKGKVTFSRLYKAEKQKQGSKTVEVKQVITTTSYYAGKKYNSDLQDALVDDSTFGAEEQSFSNTSTRVAWLLVPSDYTEAKVKEMLAKHPNQCIQQITSNAPILNDNQKQAINSGLTTLDSFANSQAIRYGSNSDNAGQLILDGSGRIQYKVNVWKKEATEDIDLRGNGEMYASQELIEEMNGASIYADQGL